MYPNDQDDNQNVVPANPNTDDQAQTNDVPTVPTPSQEPPAPSQSPPSPFGEEGDNTQLPQEDSGDTPASEGGSEESSFPEPPEEGEEEKGPAGGLGGAY